jgi:hypothetical protein
MKMNSLGLLALVLIAAAPPLEQQAPAVEIAIGRSVVSGMPVDTASSFDAATSQLAGWTRVTGMKAGSTITHVWIHGADSARVELNVGGSPWRTYSRKTIPAGATGNWTLEVRDENGATLGSRTFRIG